MLKGCSTSGSRYSELIINLMVIRKEKLNRRAYCLEFCSSFIPIISRYPQSNAYLKGVEAAP